MPFCTGMPALATCSARWASATEGATGVVSSKQLLLRVPHLGALVGQEDEASEAERRKVGATDDHVDVGQAGGHLRGGRGVGSGLSSKLSSPPAPQTGQHGACRRVERSRQACTLRGSLASRKRHQSWHTLRTGAARALLAARAGAATGAASLAFIDICSVAICVHLRRVEF